MTRAARALASGGRALVSSQDEGDEQVISLSFGVSGCDLAGAPLQSILHAAVSEPDPNEPAWQGEAGLRWRAELGAAINAGLATGPLSLTGRTSAAAYSYVRRAAEVAGHDPYVEQSVAGRCPPQAFEVILRMPRPTTGRRLRAWLARQAGPAVQIETLWRQARFLPPGQTGGIELDTDLPGYRVQLGAHATWAAAPELGGPWLVRGGVRAISLANALAAEGLEVAAMAGWIDCPALRLTADETAVVRDAAFELLVAWLHDAQAHRFNLPDTSRPQGNFGRDAQGSTYLVVWPTEVDHIATASGRAVDRESLVQRLRAGRDFLYVWRHQQSQVPTAMRARTHVLWPSELVALQQAVPDLQPVPVRALGDTPQVERVDLSTLVRSSLAPVTLRIADATTAQGLPVKLQLQAYLHRYATGAQGALVFLSYGRRVAHIRETARVIAGMTLVCELEGPPIDVLRRDVRLLQALADQCREVAEAAISELLAHAMQHPTPWELPLVRTQAEALTGTQLGLRYRADETAVVLAWEPSPLLGLALGRDATATRPVSLLQALERCRDVGGIVIERPGQTWPGWVAREPDHEPWSLSPEGRALLERVVGRDLLWDMPTLPDMHVQPRPASDQPGLDLPPGELQRLRDRFEQEKSESARSTLLGCLLAARARGEVAEFWSALVEQPLLRRFDPRALQPLRYISLMAALAEQPRPGMVALGSASRELTGVVLLATPGEAWLLHGEGFVGAGATVAARSVRSSASHAPTRPQRRAHGSGPAILAVPVATAAAVGMLRVDGIQPTKIALWSGGLHLDDLQLPAPLECVGGRLVLTRQGARAIGGGLAGEIRSMGRAVVSRAIAERRLHRPGGPQFAKLDEFLAHCHAAVAAESAPLIADLLPVSHASQAMQNLGPRLTASLQRHPLQRLPLGPRCLESLLRQSLTRPLAIGNAMLSWQPATLQRVAASGSGWDIILGRRNGLIQRATADDADLETSAIAAAVVLATLFAAARAGDGRQSALVDEWIAFYRLLALVYAHQPS